MQRRTLAAKRVIITGASSGIGEALANELADRQAKIVIAARRWEKLESLADQINSRGGECLPVQCDVCDSAQRTHLLTECESLFGGYDFLINCAGVGAMGPFEKADESRLRQIFEVNFFAAAELIRQSVPVLIQSDDALIVNIGSVLGHFAVPLKSEYCASKFALHGLSDSIRSELSKHQIDVLHVCPSTTDSEFFDAAIEDKTGRNWKSGKSMHPDAVAAKTISAIEKRKREIILSSGGKLLVWLDRIMPSTTSYFVSRFAQ